MKIERVDILGVSVDQAEIGFKLSWRDDAGNYGEVEIYQYLCDGETRVYSTHAGKDVVMAVLHALGEQSEVDD